jgi:hypothetical protein
MPARLREIRGDQSGSVPDYTDYISDYNGASRRLLTAAPLITAGVRTQQIMSSPAPATPRTVLGRMMN